MTKPARIKNRAALTASYPKAMLADLAKSGLTAKDAAALGLEYSEGDDRPCYCIPYFDLNGKPTEFFRVRYLGKLERDKKGKPIRYSQLKDSGCRFYYAHIGGIKWKRVATDVSTLWFTEGEKKSAALCKLGVPCIGLGGVDSWRTDDFDDFEWKGRIVYLAFDSDIVRKRSVQNALRKLANLLIERGAIPYMVELPSLRGTQKTGLDDFLVHHGARVGATAAGHKKALAALDALRPRSLLLPETHTLSEIAKLKLPVQKWIAEELLPVGLTLLIGKPKIGKSWLLLDLLIDVASGAPALGKFKTVRSEALYLALEDTKRRFQNRLRRTLDGTVVPNGGYFGRELPMVEEHGLDAIERWHDQHRAARLIEIDTLAKVRPRLTGKENQYQADYAAVERLKKIADERDIGIVVAHHSRKAGSDDPIDQVSGTQGLAGAADSVIVLTRPRTEADGELFMTGRDIEERTIALKLDPKTMRWGYQGEAEDYRMGQERQQILQVLKDFGKPAMPHEVAAIINKKPGAVRQMMLRMANMGLIWQVAGGQYGLIKGVEKKNEKY